MKITFVQSGEEYASMLHAVEAGDGNEEPRNVFIAPPGVTKCGKFAVVDNSDGHAWAEDFDTIDGALLYALGVRSDGNPVRNWDREGALKDWGNFV